MCRYAVQTGSILSRMFMSYLTFQVVADCIIIFVLRYHNQVKINKISWPFQWSIIINALFLQHNFCLFQKIGIGKHNSHTPAIPLVAVRNVDLRNDLGHETIRKYLKPSSEHYYFTSLARLDNPLIVDVITILHPGHRAVNLLRSLRTLQLLLIYSRCCLRLLVLTLGATKALITELVENFDVTLQIEVRLSFTSGLLTGSRSQCGGRSINYVNLDLLGLFGGQLLASPPLANPSSRYPGTPTNPS